MARMSMQGCVLPHMLASYHLRHEMKRADSLLLLRACLSLSTR
jgi:hypothetical protein